MYLKDDKYLGFYNKFKVERTDGRDSPGSPHYECDYFVLDINHDPNAKKILEQYASLIGALNPDLAADLMSIFMNKDDPLFMINDAYQFHDFHVLILHDDKKPNIKEIYEQCEASGLFNEKPFVIIEYWPECASEIYRDENSSVQQKCLQETYNRSYLDGKRLRKLEIRALDSIDEAIKNVEASDYHTLLNFHHAYRNMLNIIRRYRELESKSR